MRQKTRGWEIEQYLNGANLEREKVRSPQIPKTGLQLNLANLLSCDLPFLPLTQIGGCLHFLAFLLYVSPCPDSPSPILSSLFLIYPSRISSGPSSLKEPSFYDSRHFVLRVLAVGTQWTPCVYLGIYHIQLELFNAQVFLSRYTIRSLRKEWFIHHNHLVTWYHT